MAATYKIVFSATAGLKTTFTTVVSNLPFFQTSGVKTVFPVVKSDSPFFVTSGFKNVFPVVVAENPFFATTGIKSIFPVTQPLNTTKLLKLRFGDFVLSSDYSTIVATDATGVYSVDNPGGYNPPLDSPDINRAKRGEVDLYLAYRIWNSNGTIPDTIFPVTTNPVLTPWEYTLPIETQGVYQFYIIAAPKDTPYQDVVNRGNSIYEFAQNEESWFTTTGIVIADEQIINCINQKRFQFIESIICGDCDTKYLEMYGLYIGALNAFEIATDEAIIQGNLLLDQLREECVRENCNCNC